MSVSQQLVKSQNSLKETLYEATLEIGCVGLKWIGSRLLFWQSWTFGKYTKQATPINETVDYVEFPEETKYQTLFHDWYLSLLRSFQLQTGNHRQCHASEVLIRMEIISFCSNAWLRMFRFSHMTSRAVNRKLGLWGYDSGQCLGLNLFPDCPVRVLSS